MKTLELKNGFFWTGIVDADLRVFDVIMHTEFGTTYNSYVLKSGDKVILFETAKEKFFDQYLEKLKDVIDVSRIDYLVVNHTEPDHAGSVERLLDFSPQMKIIATGCAVGFLKEIVNRDFCAIPVKDNQTMKIGDHTFRFLSVPNLHWPDTMYTYLEEDHILVTCDSFGSHYGFPGVLASRVTDQEGYLRATRYYYDCIIGPFRPYMLKALQRVRELEIDMICPGHGPVLDQKPQIENVVKLYEEWSTVINPNRNKTVIIPYVSAYGYTGSLAEHIAEGIRDSGEVDVRLYDLVETDQAKVLEELQFADGILFGTPTIVGEALKPIWDLVTSIFAGTHGGKLASAFGSYGWSGEGVPHIMERLKQLKMKTLDPFRVRFKPGEVELKEAYEYGYNFGCVLQDKQNPKKAQGPKRLVKCLVCGAIFDASLEICPVCGVGKENFVEAEVVSTDYRNDTEQFYLILGNGAAGIHAAKAIRERDQTGSVVIVSNEPYSAYNRPMLTKSILAELTPDQIAIEEDSWYQENRIYQVLGRTVAAIHTKAKEVELDDGIRLKYDKLIYALGAECFLPPIEGREKPEVIAIRRMDDVEKIVNLLPSVQRAVVIGGGVLGLEAAWELKKAGCEVDVLELAPQLMSRQLDENAGQLLETISENCGVAIHTGVKIAAIEGDEHVTGVRLEDGTVFPAELVIVSAGVRANTKVAEAAGIAVDRAVIVNEKMETSLKDIYACGDCAQYLGNNAAIWPEAAAQGTAAGANAAGEPLAYEPAPAALSFNGMNTSLYAIGDNGKKPGVLYRQAEFKDLDKKQYEKYYFYNNRLCGAILIGDTSRMGKVTEALEKEKTFREMFRR